MSDRVFFHGLSATVNTKSTQACLMRRVRPSGTPLTWSGRPRALCAPLAPLTTLLASLFYLPLITSGGFAASKKSGKNRTKIWIFFWNSRKNSRILTDFRIPEFWEIFQNTKGMGPLCHFWMLTTSILCPTNGPCNGGRPMPQEKNVHAQKKICNTHGNFC